MAVYCGYQNGQYTFRQNMKYVYGWDQITEYQDNLYFVKNDTVYSALPEQYSLIHYEDEGLFVEGSSSTEGNYAFNLTNTDLTPAYRITDIYSLEHELDDVIRNRFYMFIDEEMDVYESLRNDSISKLYIEEFHGMTMNLDK